MREGHSFTDQTIFFGAKMYDMHTIEDTPHGLKITNTIWVTGPLAWLWIMLVAKNVSATHPKEIDALACLVHQQKNIDVS